MLHFDGSAWKPQNLPASTSDLALGAVWGFDADHLVRRGPPPPWHVSTAAEKWKTGATARGGRHGAAGLGHLGQRLLRGGGRSGGYSSSAASSGIEHCGSCASETPSPEKLRSMTMRGVWGTPDGRVVYAVGDSSTILRRRR